MGLSDLLALLTSLRGLTDADVDRRYLHLRGNYYIIKTIRAGKLQAVLHEDMLTFSQMFDVPVCLLHLLVDKSDDPVIEKMKELALVHIQHAPFKSTWTADNRQMMAARPDYSLPDYSSVGPYHAAWNPF